MRKGFKAAVSVVSSVALVSSLLAMPISAYASSGISNSTDSSTEWIPGSYYMTNTVEVDVDDDGETELAKVITTWANAWALSGPDYIGVSNSGTMNQNGGNKSAEDYESEATTTMLGIWASSVNEVPNAYNWNYFYNLYLEYSGYDTDSDQVEAVNVQNGSAAAFDSVSGVWGCFKYRPEIIWTSNSLTASSVYTYTQLIRDGSYYTSDSDYSSGTTATASDYYIDGDESYDPYVVISGSATGTMSSTASGGNSTPNSVYTLVDSLYLMAYYCELVEDETADYNSDSTASSYVTSDNVTWQTMNSLPRTTRYEVSSENAVSAREAALDVEKALRGSIYYTLQQVNTGAVDKKTVAIVSSLSTSGNSATVVEYYVAEGQRGALAGKIGASGLTVNQLTTETQASTSSDYSTYTATVDELLEADIIWAGNSDYSVETIQSWLADNATTTELQEKAESISILTDLPAIMNGHNFTFEKGICQLYSLCFFYPEIWPDLELVTYWYDNIYHINYSDLTTCLTYGLGSCTLPSSVSSLSSLPGSTYSNSDIDTKVAAGYEYYAENLTDSSSVGTGTDLEPSATLIAWATTGSADGASAVDDMANVDADSITTIDDVSDILEVVTTYEALSDDVKSADSDAVENYEAVLDAIASVVEETVAALTSADAITVADKTAVDTVLAVYEALSDEVSLTKATYTKLTAVQAALAEACDISNGTVTLAKTSYTYTGSAKKPGVTVTNSAGTTLTAGTDYTVSYSSNTNAGTAKVTVTGAGDYTGSVTKSFTIAKASQSLKVTTKTVNAKKAKKTTAKGIKKVSGAKGTVSYKKTSGSKKITVNAKTGKVTVKKGLKKGTYKVKVKVSAKATSNYKAASKTVTIKVKVK